MWQFVYVLVRQHWDHYTSGIYFSQVNATHFDGLVQERCNSSALAMELHLSCTNPSTYALELGLSCTNPSTWRLGTHKYSQWVLDLQMSCIHLYTWQGTLESSHNNDWPLSCSIYTFLVGHTRSQSRGPTLLTITSNPSFAPETGNVITNITQPLPVVTQRLAVIL